MNVTFLLRRTFVGVLNEERSSLGKQANTTCFILASHISMEKIILE